MTLELEIREWDYDNPGLVARVIDDHRGVELEQSDGFGSMRMRVFTSAELRALAEFLIAEANRKDAEYEAFLARLEAKGLPLPRKDRE